LKKCPKCAREFSLIFVENMGKYMCFNCGFVEDEEPEKETGTE